MNFGGLKITGLSRSKNLENTVFQLARLLLFHCRLVFNFASLHLQCFGHVCSKNLVSSLTKSTLNKAEYADHGHVILMQLWRGKGFNPFARQEMW